MKLGALLDLWRAEIDDVAQPFLWSDEEAIEYADDAQKEAARRGRLIVDSTTASTCQLAIVANSATYTLDARVLRINRAKLSGETTPLQFLMVRDLDARRPGWEDETGTPEIIVPDWQTGQVRLVPKPTATATLALTVVRLPILTLNDLDDTLEIREEYQRNLRHWLNYRAYLKRDSETYNPESAGEALKLFEMEFGKPQPAYDEVWMQQYYLTDAWNGRY